MRLSRCIRPRWICLAIALAVLAPAVAWSQEFVRRGAVRRRTRTAHALPVRRATVWYNQVDVFGVPPGGFYGGPYGDAYAFGSPFGPYSLFTRAPAYLGARQPVGHEIIHTGPNGYAYRPLFEEDVDRQKATAEEELPPPVPRPTGRLAL